MGKIILGYWSIRGRGAAARMMLEYGGIEWEDKTYTEFEAWFGIKEQMGFDFPNLPYLIDGDVKLTESWAVYRYIGRKIGLAPVTEKAEYEADMLQGVVDSFFIGLVEPCYKPNFEELKPKMREKQEEKLAKFDQFLDGRHFMTGGKLCFVDFVFFQTLDAHRLMFPDILDKYPNVKSYLHRFESEERIAAHLNSDRYYVFPILAPMATWGFKKPSG